MRLLNMVGRTLTSFMTGLLNINTALNVSKNDSS